ncbi:MAG: small ribosomal subunit biogenesis GTPase RsgA [Gammaproteobacteria bacterium]|nr:small ribosomal subunit biogenesis GTPase RsgA [Gammaproteobacteria bacterium]
MSKRRLNQQQAWRAEKIQQERIRRSEKKAQQLEQQLGASSLGEAQQGLVIANFGNNTIVENDFKHLFRCQIRQNLGQIVCGDRVIWHAIGDNNEGVIVARLERRTVLERPTMHEDHKAVAANIDQVFIMTAPEPALGLLLLDRYLVATELAKLDAVIVVNKIDLLSPSELAALKHQLEPYQRMGYRLIYISTANNVGAKELEQALANKVSILAGQSGVGKSSTIKYLMPDIEIQIGALSATSKLGRHTTSSSRYFHLPFGGGIIDSPGVRDFGLWQVEQDKISWGFREFRPLLGNCKFSNCSHQHEPGCAIQAAVSAGDISRERLSHFHQIIDSNKNAG